MIPLKRFSLRSLNILLLEKLEKPFLNHLASSNHLLKKHKILAKKRLFFQSFFIILDGKSQKRG